MIVGGGKLRRLNDAMLAELGGLPLEASAPITVSLSLSATAGSSAGTLARLGSSIALEVTSDVAESTLTRAIAALAIATNATVIPTADARAEVALSMGVAGNVDPSALARALASFAVVVAADASPAAGMRAPLGLSLSAELVDSLEALVRIAVSGDPLQTLVVSVRLVTSRQLARFDALRVAPRLAHLTIPSRISSLAVTAETLISEVQL